jgi:hypothetical protein
MQDAIRTGWPSSAPTEINQSYLFRGCEKVCYKIALNRCKLAKEVLVNIQTLFFENSD